MKDINMEGFCKWQQEQLWLGISEGLDVSIYALTDLDISQMKQVRLALKKNLKVENLLMEPLNAEQMEEIRIGMMQGIDVNEHLLGKGYTAKEMREIRHRLTYVEQEVVC